MAPEQIQKLDFKVDSFLNKLTLIFGPSGTGKTVFTRALMKLLTDEIDIGIVVSETAVSNKSYDGFIPSCLIHTQLKFSDGPSSITSKKAVDHKENFLKTIWEWQEMKVTIFNVANDLENLTSVAEKIDKRKFRKFFKKINKLSESTMVKLKKEYDEVTASEKIDKAKEKYDDFKKLFCKNIIRENHKRIKHEKLTKEESICVQYVDFNPRILIIFDDCAAELKNIQRTDIFRKYFYQGRHKFITTVICCQDDTDMEANLRKNAFNTIFTESKVTRSYFERSANNFSKIEKTSANKAIDYIFTEEHRMFVYIRDSKNPYYHLKVDKVKKFKFGDPEMWRYCESVKKDENEINDSSTFFSDFI